MRVLAILTVLALAAVAVTASNCRFYACDSSESGYQFQFPANGVTWSPANGPVANQDFTFSATGSVNGNAITDGQSVFVVKFNGLQVSKETDNFCNSTPCPFGPGNATLSATSKFPSGAPNGKYTIEWKATNAAGTISCIKGEFSLP